MAFLDYAFYKIIHRGYEYYISDKVASKTRISDNEFTGKVIGNEALYEVYIDVV